MPRALSSLPYKLTLALLGALLVPCLGRINLQGTGVELQLHRYFMPLAVGGTAGFLLGLLLDRQRRLLDRLQQTNRQLTAECGRHRESEARYAALFERSHTATLLIDPKSGAIADANPSACSFYGYSREQLTALNICDINQMSKNEVAVEMAKAAGNRRQQLFFQHRLASGELRDVEVYSGPMTLRGKTFLLSTVNDITELKLLRGIIPICSICKQIRDDKGYWNNLECYVQKHSNAAFTHGVCPACMERHYGDFLEDGGRTPGRSAG